MRPWPLFAAALPTLLLAQAPRERYQPIIDAKPFGDMSDLATLSAAQAEEQEQKEEIAKKFRMCGITDMPDGSRKIVEIAEVLPLEQGEYRLRPLLKWHTESVGPDGQVSGRFILGEVPGFRENAALMHLELPEYP